MDTSTLSGLNPQTFSLKKFSYFFLKRLLWKSILVFRKRTFLYFGKGIFRTLKYLELEVYSEPEAYSEHCQASTMERFVKIAT